MSARTPIEAERATGLALAALGNGPGAVVYADLIPRGPGTFVIGREAIWVDRAVLLAFRDEFPGATWLHPCTYALIDLDTGGVLATATADRPPHFGELPRSWIVAADPDGRADLIASG